MRRFNAAAASAVVRRRTLKMTSPCHGDSCSSHSEIASSSSSLSFSSILVVVLWLIVVDRPTEVTSLASAASAASVARNRPFQTSLIFGDVTASSSSLRRHHRTPIVELKLGVILPYSNTHPWSLTKVLPAIQLAVERVFNQSGGTLRFVVHEGDSQCSETYGPLVAIDMYLKRSADVFVGPACDYAVAPIARFSPHWNIPIVTGGALVQAFGSKSVHYRLLTRMSSSYAKLGQFMVDVVESFNWTSNVGIVYHSNLGPRAAQFGKTECYFTIEGVYAALQMAARERTGSASLASETLWTRPFDVHDALNASALLTEISQRARSMQTFTLILAFELCKTKRFKHY
jgi:hypothetical protein